MKNRRTPSRPPIALPQLIGRKAVRLLERRSVDLADQGLAAIARWAGSDNPEVRASALVEAGSCFEHQGRISHYIHGQVADDEPDGPAELTFSSVLLRMLAEAEDGRSPSGTDEVSLLIAGFAVADDPADRARLLKGIAQAVPSGPDSHPAGIAVLLAQSLRATAHAHLAGSTPATAE